MPKVRKLSQEEVERLAAGAALRETEDMPDPASQHSHILEDTYPYVAAWVDGGGWIEIGQDDYSRSFIRILDTGGMVWEGKTKYPSLDAAIQDAEMALARLEETGEVSDA
jgi:hypothetical protein